MGAKTTSAKPARTAKVVNTTVNGKFGITDPNIAKPELGNASENEVKACEAKARKYLR